MSAHSSTDVAASSRHPSAHHTAWSVFAFLVVACAALMPRVVGLADFHTIDEAYHWQLRGRLFAQALADGNRLATSATGHPGVTRVLKSFLHV